MNKVGKGKALSQTNLLACSLASAMVNSMYTLISQTTFKEGGVMCFCKTCVYVSLLCCLSRGKQYMHTDLSKPLSFQQDSGFIHNRPSLLRH